MAATQHPSRATEQAEFAAYFSKYTGLSPKVVAHWLLAEQPLGSAASANSNDWLNVEAGASGAGVGSSEEKRIGAMSPNKAARATAEWIEKNQPSILASAGHSEATQYAAIERSGFAESHYAGGLASAGSTADISFLTEALKEGGQLLEGPLGPTTEGEKELGEGLGSVEKKAEGIVGGVEGAGKAAMIITEWIGNPVRVLKLVGGGILLGIGLKTLTHGSAFGGTGQAVGQFRQVGVRTKHVSASTGKGTLKLAKRAATAAAA